MLGSLMRVLVNPVDAAVFQPPKPTYSSNKRGTLVPEAALVCLDPANGFYCVEVNPSTEDGAQASPSVCLVWAHGNACDCGEESGGLAVIAKALNVSIVAPEFPGYGVSPGVPSEDGVDRALEAAYEYARSKEHVETIILVGRSVGTGPVCRLARKITTRGADMGKVAALVLWSAITSIKDQCAQLAGSTISSFIGNRWAPIEDLHSVTCPVVFICGERDSLATPAMAERLRKACTKTDTVFMHYSELADHNENWDLFLDLVQPVGRLLDFIDESKRGQVDVQPDPIFSEEDQLPIPSSSPDALLASGIIKPNDEAEICIIGSGPVGLFIACNLIHRGFPGDKIVCVDKYATFQRSHVLRLEKHSVVNAPKSLVELVEDQLGVTRTNTLEAKLANECKEKNVAFMRPFEVKETSDFVARFVPNAKVVVCSDGAHSSSREQLFGGLEKRYTLEYVLDCRGEVVSATRPSTLSFPQIMDLLGKITHIGDETVGRNSSSGKDDGTTTWPITFRLLITGEEIDAIRATGKGTARNPLECDTDEALFPEKIRESVTIWKESRSKHFPDETIKNLKCVAIDLNCYRASQYVAFDQEQTPKRVFFLCGDAAFGVPFFRALNNGLLCASECARSIMELLADPESVQSRTRLGLSCNRAATETDGVEHGRPKEYKSILGRSYGLVAASTGLSSKVSQILAHTSFERGVNSLMPESSDPAQRYDDFVRRLARKEFAVAGLKRDALEITKHANVMRNKAVAKKRAVKSKSSSTSV